MILFHLLVYLPPCWRWAGLPMVGVGTRWLLKVPSNSMHSMIASYFHARNTMKLLTMLLERQSSSLAMKGLKSKDNVMQIFLQYSIFLYAAGCYCLCLLHHKGRESSLCFCFSVLPPGEYLILHCYLSFKDLKRFQYLLSSHWLLWTRGHNNTLMSTENGEHRC